MRNEVLKPVKKDFSRILCIIGLNKIFLPTKFLKVDGPIKM